MKNKSKVLLIFVLTSLTACTSKEVEYYFIGFDGEKISLDDSLAFSDTYSIYNNYSYYNLLGLYKTFYDYEDKIIAYDINLEDNFETNINNNPSAYLSLKNAGIILNNDIPYIDSFSTTTEDLSLKKEEICNFLNYAISKVDERKIEEKDYKDAFVPIKFGRYIRIEKPYYCLINNFSLNRYEFNSTHSLYCFMNNVKAYPGFVMGNRNEFNVANNHWWNLGLDIKMKLSQVVLNRDFVNYYIGSKPELLDSFPAKDPKVVELVASDNESYGYSLLNGYSSNQEEANEEAQNILFLYSKTFESDGFGFNSSNSKETNESTWSFSNYYPSKLISEFQFGQLFLMDYSSNLNPDTVRIEFEYNVKVSDGLTKKEFKFGDGYFAL